MRQTEFYRDSIDQLYTLVQSYTPIIWVTTHEENRFIQAFETEISTKLNRDLWTWSSYYGLNRYSNKKVTRASGEFDQTWNPNTALDRIMAQVVPSDRSGQIFILKDFHTVLSQPVPRQIRDIYISLLADKKTLLIVAPCIAHGPSGTKGGMEPTLEKQISVVEFELPSRDFIKNDIQKRMSDLYSLSKNKNSHTLSYTEEEYIKFAMSLQGLTSIEIDNSLATCITKLKAINEKYLLQEKKQTIKRSDILEYVGITPSFNEVGGCDELKNYFRLHADQFSTEAEEFGVEPLRGVLMLGVCGTGKSLAAKAVSAEWGLPLIRLDIGKVMGSLVGLSEERMRQAISQAEAIAPCVLYLDEIEKALSGTKSSGQSDGGTLSRVFGTLLTAMEEGMKGVILIATANDISALPPELVRRFSEVFFVDLPTPEEREEIFKIHLKKRGRDADLLGLDMNTLVNTSHLYTGSEIEKAVREGIIRAFHDGKRLLQTDDILEALQETKAISKIMKEKIDEIRDWARNRARYASSLAAAANTEGAQKITSKKGKKISVGDAIEEIPIKKNVRKEAKVIKDVQEDRISNILEDSETKVN